jgi:ABC-type Fe3+ transport system permease subunit
MGATGVAWWLGGVARDIRFTTQIFVAGVIITAFVKVWMVGLQFMEIKSAPRLLRYLFEGWTVALCAALIVVCCK